MQFTWYHLHESRPCLSFIHCSRAMICFSWRLRSETSAVPVYLFMYSSDVYLQSRSSVHVGKELAVPTGTCGCYIASNFSALQSHFFSWLFFFGFSMLVDVWARWVTIWKVGHLPFEWHQTSTCFFLCSWVEKVSLKCSCQNCFSSSIFSFLPLRLLTVVFSVWFKFIYLDKENVQLCLIRFIHLKTTHSNNFSFL